MTRMRRVPGAGVLLAVLASASVAQTVRVVVPQGTGAPALGQLGAVIQGAAGQGPTQVAPALSRSALSLPATVLRTAPGTAVIGAGAAAAPAAGNQALSGAQAEKLAILLERASGASALASAADPSARTSAQSRSQTPAATRVLFERVATELEGMSTERLRSMPLEELNAWSARLLEGPVSVSGSEVSKVGTVPTLLAPAAGLGVAARAQAPAAEPQDKVPAPKTEEPPIPAEAQRTIRGFTLARIFSISVFALHQIAFAFMAIDAVGGGAFATVMLISGLASIPLAFVNGMLVDKLSPRHILVGGSTLLGVASVVMGLLNTAGLISFGTLIPLSIITQFMLIAVIVGEASLIPKILKDAPYAIPRTFARFDLIFAGISALASVAGGIAVKAYLGYSGTFFLYAAIQALVVIPIYLWFMPKVEQTVKANPGFMEAMSRLKKSPYLLGLLGLSFAAVLLVYPLRITLLPVIINKFLGGTTAQLGFVNTAVFLGMLGASVFNVTLAKKFANSRLLIASAAAFGGFGVLLAFPTSMTAM
ncbi:MAG: hypothetical protein HY553_03105, partial [Elusimicrobia bacterium]|nr:hypothetical protein [Elusimicrobiota bacterium]